MGPIHLRAEIGLRAVDHDQVRLERKNPLDVGIDEAAHLRFGQRLGRKSIEIAHADNSGPRAHREQHFGDGRDQRDDALRRRLRQRARREQEPRDGQKSNDRALAISYEQP